MGRGTVLQLVERTLVFLVSIFIFANVLFIWTFVMNDPEGLFQRKMVPSESPYRTMITDDLRLDGSLSEQYSNFMVKMFSGDFFLSTGVRYCEPISDFIYQSAFTTAGILIAALVLSMVIAGTYGYLANRWSSRLKGKVMLTVALLLAVAFAISLWFSILSALNHIGVKYFDHPFTFSVLMASIPVSAGFVLVVEGLLRRVDGRGLGELKGLVTSVLRAPGSTAILSLFAVYALICTLLADFYISAGGLGSLTLDALMHFDVAVLTVSAFLLATMLLLVFLLIEVVRIFVSADEMDSQASAEEPGTEPQVTKLFGALTWSAVPALWAAFRKDRVALFALIILAALVVAGAFAPILSTVQNPGDYGSYEPNLLGDGVPLQLNPMPPSLSPSEGLGVLHPLGTDPSGRDVYSLLLYDTLGCVGVAVLMVAVALSAGIWAGVVRFYAEGRRPSVRGAVSRSSLVASEVLLLLPLLVVMFPLLYHGHERGAIVALALVAWMWAVFGKAEAINILPSGRDGVRRSRGSPFMAEGAAAIVYGTKFCFLFGFLLVAYYSHTFWPLGWLEVGWVDTLEAAYQYGAFYRGTWWLVIPPMVMIGLLAGSIYVLLDRLERMLLSWSTTSEEVPPQAGPPPPEP